MTPASHGGELWMQNEHLQSFSFCIRLLELRFLPFWLIPSKHPHSPLESQCFCIFKSWLHFCKMEIFRVPRQCLLLLLLYCPAIFISKVCFSRWQDPRCTRKQTPWLSALLPKSCFPAFASLTQCIQEYFQNENALSSSTWKDPHVWVFNLCRAVGSKQAEIMPTKPICKGSELASAPGYKFVGWGPYSSITFTVTLHLNRHIQIHLQIPCWPRCTYLGWADTSPSNSLYLEKKEIFFHSFWEIKTFFGNLAKLNSLSMILDTNRQFSCLPLDQTQHSDGQKEIL